MADDLSPISRKLELDTTDFKTGLSAINRDIRVLESSFRASAAGLQDWAKDATGLETRIKSLNAQIEDQRMKVALLAREHERVALAEGADSKAAQDLQIRLNQATGTLNKMQLELTQDQAALQGVKQGGEAAGAGMDQAAKKGVTLKDVLSGVKTMAQGAGTALSGMAKIIQGELAAAFLVLKVGVGAILGIGAAALAAGALVGGLGLKAITAADQLGELADKTGISVIELQKLNFIGQVIGTDLDTITTANARMIRSMDSAKKGTGAQADAFKTLGVRVKDSSGNLRDANTVFGEVLDALAKIQNPTERDALAMAIFGKSAQELNPLILAGSAGMEAAANRASKLGAIVSTETVQSLGSLKDRLDELKLGMGGFGTTLLGAIANFLNLSGVLDGAMGLWSTFVLSIKSGEGVDLSKVPGALGDMATSIVKSLAAAMPDIARIGVEIVKALADSFSQNLPDLLQAGQDILKTLIDAIVSSLPAIQEAAPGILNQLSNALLTVLPMLFGVGSQIILTLINVIAKVLPEQLPKMKETGLLIIKELLNAVKLAFPVLAELVPEILQTLIDFFLQNAQMLISVGLPLINQLIQAILPQLPVLVEAAIQIVVALANGLAEALPTLTPAIVDVLLRIVQILLENLPLLLKAALAIIKGLADGLITALPILLEALPQLVTAIVGALIEAVPLILGAAAQILVALALGIVQNIPVALTAVLELIRQLVNKLIAEGQSGAANAGKAVIDGLKQGWADNWESFKSQVMANLTALWDWITSVLGPLFTAPGAPTGPKGPGAGGGTGVQQPDTWGSLLAGATAALNSATSSVVNATTTNTQSDTFQFFAPVYLPSGSTSELATKLKARRF
jgi:phage terminase Nu1 subunit (DNA packaging protein)